MKPYDAYIFDLDGTVYLGETMLPTALDTITHLRSLGKRTVFLSNNPTHTREEYAAKLTRLGLPTPVDDSPTPSSPLPAGCWTTTRTPRCSSWGKSR